mmetsp:Transcript_28694/g.40028  ORF Transcript_28694/g.40028 Transcript_28694/m.40028 type:complete len:416 (+) Transcript_28694:81-1328(+)
MGSTATNVTLRWVGGSLLFVPMALFAFPGFGKWMETTYYARDNLELTRFRRQWVPFLISIILVLPNILLLKAEEEDISTLVWNVLIIYVYIALPMAVCMMRPPGKLPLDTGDLCLVLLLAVPVLSNFYTDLLPDVKLQIKESWPKISMLMLTAVNSGLFVFNGLRPLRDFGFSLLFSCKDMLRVISGLVLAAMLLLPIGYLTENFGKGTDNPKIEWAIAQFLTVYLLVSLPQEILFRGVIQNLLHSRLESSAEISKYTQDQREALCLGDYPRYAAIDDNEMHEDSDDSGNGTDEDILDPEATIIYTGFQAPNAKEYQEIHQDFYSRGICCWLSFPTFMDYMALLITSLVYAIAVMDHRQWSHQKDGEVFLFALLLGVVCGYVWRQTSKVTASALVHSIIYYVGVHIFNAKLSAAL